MAFFATKLNPSLSNLSLVLPPPPPLFSLPPLPRFARSRLRSRSRPLSLSRSRSRLLSRLLSRPPRPPPSSSLSLFLFAKPSIIAAPIAALATLAPLAPIQSPPAWRCCIAACAPAEKAVRAPFCTIGFCHHLALVDAGIDWRRLADVPPAAAAARLPEPAGGGRPRAGDLSCERGRGRDLWSLSRSSSPFVM